VKVDVIQNVKGAKPLVDTAEVNHLTNSVAMKNAKLTTDN
jgi:hypothetical protein